MTAAAGEGPLAPVLHELSRITGAVESERAERDRATIEALRREVLELRATVARLRGSRTVLARTTRPVAARPAPGDGDPPRRRHASA